MARRRFLAPMATWPLAALIPITTFPEPRSASLKIVLKSACDSATVERLRAIAGWDWDSAKVARNVRLICAGDVEALERAA